MKRLVLAMVLVAGPGAAAGGEAPADAPKPDADGWYALFNGKDLAGWKVSENPASIKVEDGAIVCHGPRAHAFYTGPVCGAAFKNFDLLVEVKTLPKTNSGIYFHTEYQDTGYPAKGHEAQINNTAPDARKTGSLYAVQDLKESPVKDGEWFTYRITVRGRHIVFQISGKTVNEWTEPEGYKHPQRPRRGLSSGTIALQGHDPESTARFRNIRIRPLPDE